MRGKMIIIDESQEEILMIALKFLHQQVYAGNVNMKAKPIREVYEAIFSDHENPEYRKIE